VSSSPGLGQGHTERNPLHPRAFTLELVVSCSALSVFPPRTFVSICMVTVQFEFGSVLPSSQVQVQVQVQEQGSSFYSKCFDRLFSVSP